MKPSWDAFFKGKKITVMGLGLLGRGVGDVAFMAGCGANLTVTDLKSAEELSGSLERLKIFPDIKYVLGEHRIEDFQTADMIVKAAGIPLDSPHIAEAQRNGIPVYMSTALFAHLAGKGVRLIGVTGTRGKSTVTTMIYNALVRSGFKTHLGGNVRGVSTLSLLPETGDKDIVVLELDSWQLQGFRDVKISPHIAVFTNLMPDHMNYYKDDMDRYFYDKAGIFAHQGEGDTLIAGPKVAPKIEALKPATPVTVPPPLPADWKLSVPGEHNRQNAALARCALQAVGVDGSVIREALESYAGIEGRLNLIADIGGVKIYNDSNSTTPEAVIAALRSFPEGTALLLAGGTDKNLSLEAMAAEVRDKARKVALLAGNGTERLAPLLPGVPVFGTLEEAFTYLAESARTGDNLIFSPGFASFGPFKNEYDRMDRFTDIVSRYKDSCREGTA